MASIIEAFEAKRRLLAGNGVPEESIGEAEKALEIKFSPEYREYLLRYGIAAYNGHELTGITKSERTNVVAVTKAAREKYPDIPLNLYVIEETGVEEVLIWQSEEGKVYYSSPNQPLTELCESFREYILK